MQWTPPFQGYNICNLIINVICCYQNAEVAGKQYEFEVQESRDNAKLARLYGQQTGQQNMADQATMAKQSAWGNFAGAAGSAAMNFATAGVSGGVFK